MSRLFFCEMHGASHAVKQNDRPLSETDCRALKSEEQDSNCSWELEAHAQVCCKVKKLPGCTAEAKERAILEFQTVETHCGVQSVKLSHLPDTGPKYTMTLPNFLQDRIRPAAPDFARQLIANTGAELGSIPEEHCGYLYSLEGFYQTASEALVSVGQITLWIYQLFVWG